MVPADLKWAAEGGSTVLALALAYLILRLPPVAAVLMRLASSGSEAVVKGVLCDEAAVRRVVQDVLDAHQKWEEARQDELVRQLSHLTQTVQQFLSEIQRRA